MRFPLIVLGIGSWLWPISPSCDAQDPSAAKTPAGPTLDQTLAPLETLEANITKQIDALRKVVDDEVMAKRLTDSAAQSLRFSLRALSLASGTEFSSVVSSSRHPAENAAVMEAIKSLEAAWNAAQTQRFSLIKKAAAEIRTRLGSIGLSSKSIAEIDSLIAAIDRLQQAVPIRNTSNTAALGTSNLSTYTSFLRARRRLVELQADPRVDPMALGAALSQLQNQASNTQGAIDDAMLQKCIQDALGPYQKAQDEAQEKLDSLLLANKPAAEITVALTKLEEAAERYQQVQSSQSSSRRRDISNALSVYRNLALTLTAIDAGQHAQARTLLSTVRSSSLQSLGAAKVTAFSQLVTTWDKTIEENATKAANKRREELRTWIDAVKRPADLEALGAELFKLESEARGDRELDFPRGLASQLNALAAAWVGSSRVDLQACKLEYSIVSPK